MTEKKKTVKKTVKKSVTKKVNKPEVPQEKEHHDGDDPFEEEEESHFNFGLGAVYSGFNFLVNSAGKIDQQVTDYTGGLTNKLTDYFDSAIERYKTKS